MVPEIHLRPATAADQLAIRQLIRQVGINPFDLHWPRFVVAEIDGQFAGCAQLKPHRDGSLELASVAVQPSLQGQGIGAALVQHFCRIVPGDLYLMCAERNATYYTRFGFINLQRPADMPPGLRRTYQLARWVRPIFGGLAIMHRPPPETSP
mgnify:CR=1 FL=1